MQLRCCGDNVNCGEVWFLKDISGFTARKLFIGKCKTCGDDVAILFETRTNDKKTFINEFKGIEAVKTIYREKKRKITVLPDIKTDCLWGWVYGVNTVIKKKGKIIKIRQYASDFKGNKNLRKEIVSV